MAIREIFNYIKAHRGELSEEELFKKLKEQGYGDDEIKEASLMGAGSLGEKPASGFENRPEGEKPPTLGDAIFSRFKNPEASATQVAGKKAHDFSAVETRGEFWMGLFIPVAIYFFSLVIFLFLELFYSVTYSVQLGAAGISVAVSLLLKVILKGAASNLKRGMRDGIIIILFWAIISTLSFLKMLPFSLG